MARKISKKDNRYLARLVTGEKRPCAFCLREVDDEITYGKLYAIGDIQCHYYCCLLSCCLIQKGHEEEGLFGFMYSDILAEVERCKKHKCSYCGRSGANLGCSVGVCRKQFHVPCGRDKNAVSLYYGSYKSFCQLHAPKQKIPEHIMEKAQLRKKVYRARGNTINKLDCDVEGSEETICLICYEAVEGFPTVNTFWPPCCGKDAWFHRNCLQRMALSAGMHYLKCPLCNDKENFYEAVVNQGYYVPDRDAAWELEQNAFAEIYERPATCSAESCLCPLGRSHDAENGKWDIKLCLLCGSAGAHAQCIADQSQPPKPDTVSLDKSETTQASTLDHLEIIEATLTAQSETKEEMNLCIEANELRNEDVLSMEQLNTSPDKLNTSPDKSNTSPDKLNTSPDKSNTSPDKSNTSPDKSNPSPDKSNTSPDKSNPSPDKLNPSPDNLNTSPDKSNTSPDKSNTSVRFVCRSCLPAAPEDLDSLASSIEAIIQQEQAQSTAEPRRPVMPSRMSIRRTKGRRAIMDRPSTSRSNRFEAHNELSETPNIVSSRLELNLKSPRRLPSETISRETSTDNKMVSPLKLLEQTFREKMVVSGVGDAVLDAALVDTLTRQYRKPRPLCERKRILNHILDGIIADLLKDSKQKVQVKKWCSPQKCYDSMEGCKELLYELSDSSKELESGQNKENDSNTSNTPSKDPKNNKVDTISNPIIADKLIEDDCQKDDEDVKNIDFSLARINRHKYTKDNATEHQNNENDFNHIDAKLNIVKTDVTAAVIEQNNVKIEETAEQNEIEKLTKNETNVQDSTEELSLKRSFKKKKSKSPKGVEKLKPFPSRNNSYKDKQKIRSKSESSSSNILLFKTEKDLCSQLLLELTKGKVNNENINDSSSSEIQKIITNAQNTLNKTSKNTDETPKREESTKDSNETSKGFDSQFLTESPIELEKTPNNLIDIPKHKTIDIEQSSSVEISANNQHVNIEVIKIEDSPTTSDSYKKLKANMSDQLKTCFKFSPKEGSFDKNDTGIDLESFKKEYLSEVDREFKCSFKHKHIESASQGRSFRSPIDFALEAATKKDDLGSNNKKRKLSESGVKLVFGDNVVKRRRTSESDLKLVHNYDKNTPECSKDFDKVSVDDNEARKKNKDKRRKKEEKARRKAKRSKRRSSDKNIEVTIDSSEKRSNKHKKTKKKIKTKFEIKNQNIKVKIQWKKKQLSLNIESKKQAKKNKKVKDNHSKFKQYVLQFPEGTSKEVLVRPEKEVCPIKRKYLKNEKSPDKLKQMSIDSFFKLKSE